MANPINLPLLSRSTLLLGWATTFACLVPTLLSGPGHRFGFFDFRLALKLFRYGGWLSYPAIFLLLLAAISAGFCRDRRRVSLALLGLFFTLPILAGLLRMQRRLSEAPRIHDISTDTENPPSFVAILPLRANAPNPANYGGPEVAQKQKDSYPYIFPIDFSIPPETIFDRALSYSKELGWEIVSVDKSQGRIEATVTTLWFGFKDDIVIRVQKTPLGARLDVRSVSRVGQSDLGENAKRIRSLFYKFIP